MKVEIDQKTANAINEYAALNGMQPESIIAESIQNPETARYWRERAEDTAALEAMKNGDYISKEDMEAKMNNMIKTIRAKQQQSLD